MIPPFTIVLRTRNGIETARQTFAALRAQSIPTGRWIVMDCRSTDGVRELARRYGARVLDVDPDAYFPGRVLNRAVEAADTELVVFVNSDTVPLSPTSLVALLSPFAEDPSTVATFGRQVARPKALPWVRGDYETAFPEHGPAPEWLPLSLPFSAVRRRALLERPFYTEAWASEDTEWGSWARAAGHRVVYAPEAVAMHSHNYTLPEIWGRRFVEGEADAFISPEARRALDVARGLLSTTVRDLRRAIRGRAWAEALRTPVRRAVFWAAWSRGHRMGALRRRRAIRDTSAGQSTILRLRRDA